MSCSQIWRDRNNRTWLRYVRISVKNRYSLPQGKSLNSNKKLSSFGYIEQIELQDKIIHRSYLCGKCSSFFLCILYTTNLQTKTQTNSTFKYATYARNHPGEFFARVNLFMSTEFIARPNKSKVDPRRTNISTFTLLNCSDRRQGDTLNVSTYLP